VLPNVVKIDPYNLELHRFKVGTYFETWCKCVLITINRFSMFVANSLEPTVNLHGRYYHVL